MIRIHKKPFTYIDDFNTVSVYNGGRLFNFLQVKDTRYYLPSHGKSRLTLTNQTSSSF